MSGFSAPAVAWAQLAPVIIVFAAAVLGVLVEAFVPARRRRAVELVLALAAPAGAIVAVAALWGPAVDNGGTAVLGGSLVIDPPALVVQGVLAVFALLGMLVVADRTSTGEDAFAPTAAAVPGSAYEELARSRGLQQTEVFPLLLFATGGMLLFAAAGDLLILFIALEVLSLPLYVLTGMARRRRLLSQEASMKYFLLGAFASAIMLFGIALLYGFSGSVRYAQLAKAATGVVGMDGLLLAGLVLVLVGLLFKVGAVPFHSWTPDVYQGAPTPVTGYMAAGTKIAAFGALVRLVYVVTPDLTWDLTAVLWTVAIATMVVGTLATIAQTDVKRMLGWSAVAHTGFILTGVVSLDIQGIWGVLFYLAAYGAATVGAFAVVSLVRERSAAPVEPVLVGPEGASLPVGEVDGTEGATLAAGGVSGGSVLGEATDLSQWAGLGRTHPAVATTFALFLLSFAGIPLTAGFIAKFGVFSAAVAGNATPLAIVGALASAVSVFFYVRVIVLMFFSAPASAPADDEDAGALTTTTVVGSQGFTAVAIAVCAAIVVLLGVLPGPLLDVLGHAATFLP